MLITRRRAWQICKTQSSMRRDWAQPLCRRLDLSGRREVNFRTDEAPVRLQMAESSSHYRQNTARAYISYLHTPCGYAKRERVGEGMFVSEFRQAAFKVLRIVLENRTRGNLNSRLTKQTATITQPPTPTQTHGLFWSNFLQKDPRTHWETGGCRLDELLKRSLNINTWMLSLLYLYAECLHPHTRWCGVVWKRGKVLFFYFGFTPRDR